MRPVREQARSVRVQRTVDFMHFRICRACREVKPLCSREHSPGKYLGFSGFRRRRASALFAVSATALGALGCNASSGVQNQPPPAAQLSASAGSISFGNVPVGKADIQSITLSDSGNAGLRIQSITVSGTGFAASGPPPPSTLAPEQSASLSIAFSPSSTGSYTGQLSIVSNAGNSPTLINLDGSGVQPPSHSAELHWTASDSAVAGYNAYRGTVSGGPYAKLNASLITATTYTDLTVQTGQTYYYVVTAIGSNKLESVYSKQVSATIP